MYCIKYNGKFKCDWYYSLGDAGWKTLEDAYNILLIEDKLEATMRMRNLEIIYGRGNIELAELTEEDLQIVTIAKLKFTGRSNS